MTTMTYLEAGKAALAEEMRSDPRVWALGEDLGRGGVFGQYRGLAEEFGPERIVDAPISEAAIMGCAVGAALAGTRPVVEMRFSDFALCAVDELVNQAAKARYMFGGQSKVPLVAREPVGMWRSSAAQHSQSLESWYTHIPGLVVVMPATPADNKGLLKSAIRCDDPVVYMEHKDLWGLEGEVPGEAPGEVQGEAPGEVQGEAPGEVQDEAPGEVPGDGEHVVPLGVANVVLEGDDVTIVTWSKTVHAALDAARSLAGTGIAAEIIDLRTLWPWDTETVYASVWKTGRLVVAHEAVTVSGFGAEVAASVGEECFGGLRAPIRRLGSPRAQIAYAPSLEDLLRVDAAAIAGAAASLIR